MVDKEYVISQKQKDALEVKIDKLKDTMSDLRKVGKDPFTENLELKEIISKINLIYEDPKKEKLEIVKTHLNKITLALKKMGEETEEDLIKQYREKEEE